MKKETNLNVGDIIVISRYISPDNVEIQQHSFVVLNNQAGTIAGVEIKLNLELNFDLVATAMSSIKNEQHKKKIQSYFPKDMIVEFNDAQISNGNRKDGYIKANQLYYFQKDSISYFKLGKLNVETFNKLIELVKINEKNGDLISNYNNIIPQENKEQLEKVG